MEANVLETLIHPDDLERIFGYFEVFQNAEDGAVSGIEYRAHHAEGQWLWLYTQCVVFNRTIDGSPHQLLGISIDITNRKQSEQALQESEAWTRLATQVAQLGAWRLHLESNLVELDERMRQIWGEPEDAVLLPLPAVLERIHPDDRERVAAAVDSALDPASTGVYEIEYRIWWNDGTERWILANGQAQFFGEGAARQVVDFFGTALDITDRKQAEAALTEQKQRYRYIFESVNIAIWDEDFSEVKAAIAQLKADGVQNFHQYFNEHPEVVQRMAGLVRIQDINQSALKMFGAQEKKELMSSLNQIFVPETQAVFIEELLAIAEGQPSFAAETVLQTLQGDRFSVWFSIAFPPASDSYDHVLVSLIDITQRKQSDLERERSEERLSLALKAANQGLYDLNVQTGEAIVSPEYARMLGYEPEEFQETNARWRDRMHPDDVATVYRVYEEYVAGLRDEYWVEFRQRTKTGGWVWILSIGKIVSWNQNGNPLRMLGTHTDISERKRIEVEREQLLQRAQTAREQAEAANRVKDEFLAVLSHELRSPLNPILGWTKLLQTGQFDAQKTKQALGVIERNAKQQTQLIDDLLDVSKILRGKLALNQEPINLVLMIEAVLETVRLSAEAKEIRLETALDSSLPSVLGDSGRLQQIVLNLLTNAIKFTPAGGQVTVSLEQSGKYAQIRVKDTGKGITPDFLPYVFESFRQEDSKTTRRFGGLGLGLAIVRQLTELHGGSAHAESEGEGTGATFTIRLPLMRMNNTASESSIRATDRFSAANALQGVRVLIVDDEADMRDLMVTVLEYAGATVQVAVSAAEALEMFDQFQPSIVVSDIGMPDMDGYMLMQQIRGRPLEQGGLVPAIALTAYAGEYDQQQALQVGFQRHIAKPAEPESLIQAISNLCNSIATEAIVNQRQEQT